MFQYDEGKSPLALLAETCRNIGVDTSTSKFTKTSIDHVKSSSSSSSLSSSSSSSSSVESSSRKNNDSCLLSVSPLRNATPVTPTSRTSANSVNGSNTNSNINSNVKLSVTPASNHSSSSGSGTGNNNNNSSTTVINSESNGCSFKPYEDHIITKKKCLDEPKNNRSTKVHDSDNRNKINSNKHYVNNSNASKTHESNGLNKREIVKSSSNVSTSSSPSTSSTSVCTSSSSSTTSTSTAHANHSSSSTPSKGSNCNGCLPPHAPSSTPHPLSLDNVAKFLPYPSLSPYLPPPPNGYDPVAAVAAAVASHCHSPSMCRDPFCAGCRFNAANVLGPSTCPAGCTQCSHASNSMNHQLAALQANGYLPGNAFYPPPPHPHHQHPHHHPGNPPTSSANSPHTSASAAAAAAAAAAASSANGNLSKLNICSWAIGGNYCGKRFNTAEELHQHLRNHTSTDPSVSALALLGQYQHLYPMLINPIAGLRRTAFDPVNRYHPYKSLSANGSPLSTLPNGLTGAIHKPPPGAQMNMHYPYGPIKLMLEK